MEGEQVEYESGIDESKHSSQPVRVTESEHGVRGTSSPGPHARSPSLSIGNVSARPSRASRLWNYCSLAQSVLSGELATVCDFTSSRACRFISGVTGGAGEDCGCLAWQRATAKRWQESSFNTILFLPGMSKKITKRPGLRLFRGAVLVTSLCRALQPGLLNRPGF